MLSRITSLNFAMIRRGAWPRIAYTTSHGTVAGSTLTIRLHAKSRLRYRATLAAASLLALDIVDMNRSPAMPAPAGSQRFKYRARLPDT